MKEQGYRCELEDGQKLAVTINERGWTVTLAATPEKWKPAVHAKDPIWEDTKKWRTIPETLEINEEEWNKFRASVQQQEAEEQIKKHKEAPKKPDEAKTDDAITTKALEILRSGDPIEYIINSCKRYVLGGEKAFRKLCCCIATQDIMQSAGLHPRLSGESGMGKSLITLVFAHHLPPEIVSVGSSSNLAVFYHEEGNRVFRILDDYVAGGNDTIDTIIKQTSTVYHQVYAHKTVKDMEPTTLYIGSEQTWAITAVDASQDIQVLNRQIPINVDDSEALTIEVNKSTIARYAAGQEQFFMDETVQICREMWRILRAENYIDIKVPFGDRIEWLDNSNRRNPSIFMDLVIAHTAMRRLQRRKSDDDCYLATEDDFHSAESLFKDKDAEELVKRLTKKERQLAENITAHKEGIGRDALAKEMGVSGNRISQLIHGEKNKGGLAAKMPGLVIEDTTETARGDVTSTSIRKTMYKLTGYDPLSGFDMVVNLKPSNNGDGKKHDDENLPGKPVIRSIVSKGIDMRERERESSKDSKEKVLPQENDFSPKNEKNSFLSLDPKNPNSPYSSSIDNEKAPLPASNKSLTGKENLTSEAEKEMLRKMQDEEQREHGMGKIDRPTPMEKQSTCKRLMERIRKTGKPVTNFAVRTAMREAGYDLDGKEIEALMVEAQP